MKILVLREGSKTIQPGARKAKNHEVFTEMGRVDFQVKYSPSSSFKYHANLPIRNISAGNEYHFRLYTRIADYN